MTAHKQSRSGHQRSNRCLRPGMVGVGLGLVMAVSARPAERLVSDAGALRAAAREAAAGDVLRIAPGVYPGGLLTRGVTNLTVTAADPARPPVIEGGNTGWQFSMCPGLVLRDLRFRG